MPKIPTRRRERLPELVPGIRVSPEAMTKDIRALTGFGQAISGVGELGMQFATKLKEARVTTETDNAKTTAKKAWNDFTLTLGTLDYKEYGKATQKAKDDIYKSITFTEKNAKANFDTWWGNYTVAQEFSIGKLAIAEEIRAGAADYYKNLNLLAELGDTDGIKELTRNAVKANYIHADVGAKVEATKLRRAEAVNHKRIVDMAWLRMMEVPDRKTAIEIVKTIEGLSATERNSLIGAWDKEQDHKEAKIKKEIEIIQESWRNSNLTPLREGRLTYPEIDNSPLDAKGKHQWEGWLTKQIKAIKDGKPDPLTVTKDKIYGRVAERISLDPKTVDEQKDIWAFHGEGLSTDNCIKLSKQLTTNLTDPLKADMSKRYHFGLKTLRTAGVFGRTYEENSIEYGKKANALDELLATDPTPDELEKFYEILIQPAKTDYLKDILDMLNDISRFGEVTTGVALTKEITERLLKEKPEKVERRIIRTGVIDGRKVIQYDDGSVKYAD